MLNTKHKENRENGINFNPNKKIILKNTYFFIKKKQNTERNQESLGLTHLRRARVRAQIFFNVIAPFYFLKKKNSQTTCCMVLSKFQLSW